ncbi:hypothetical protein ACFY36_28740 [Actinoplanes sp. NPDC000266]
MTFDKQAVITSHVDAPPERVWTALTDAGEDRDGWAGCLARLTPYAGSR